MYPAECGNHSHTSTDPWRGTVTHRGHSEYDYRTGSRVPCVQAVLHLQNAFQEPASVYRAA